MFCALIVACLGHDEWKVREAASAVCKAPQFEPYLRHAYTTSESAEVRMRAGEIIRRIDAKRENDLYVNDPETYYRRWFESGGNNYYVSDERLIKDVQQDSKRKAIIDKLSQEYEMGEPGPWTRPNYCPYDHVTLAAFRARLP